MENKLNNWSDLPFMKGTADDKAAMILGYLLHLALMVVSFLILWFWLTTALSFCIAAAILLLVWIVLLDISQEDPEEE